MIRVEKSSITSSTTYITSNQSCSYWETSNESPHWTTGSTSSKLFNSLSRLRMLTARKRIGSITKYLTLLTMGYPNVGSAGIALVFSNERTQMATSFAFLLVLLVLLWIPYWILSARHLLLLHRKLQVFKGIWRRRPSKYVSSALILPLQQ